MSVVAASKNASTTIDQFTILQMIQDNRKAKVRQLTKAKRALDDQEKTVSAELKDREKQLKVIQDRQTTITKDLAKLQELKDKITGIVKDVVGRVAYAGQGAGNAALAIQYALAQQGKSYVWVRPARGRSTAPASPCGPGRPAASRWSTPRGSSSRKSPRFPGLKFSLAIWSSTAAPRRPSTTSPCTSVAAKWSTPRKPATS